MIQIQRLVLELLEDDTVVKEVAGFILHTEAVLLEPEDLSHGACGLFSAGVGLRMHVCLLR